MKTLGWWLCHQDPDRTISFGDFSMPLCIRCTGLFLFMGVVMWAGTLAPAPRHGARALILPALAALTGSGILLAQWLGAQLGFWHSNLVSRLLTGFASGAGLGWLIQTAFSLRFAARAGARRSNPRAWAAVLSFVLVSAGSLVLLLVSPPWPVVGGLLGAGSLAGFFTASAWCMAIILSYAIRDSDDRPRITIIAPIVAICLVVQALAMAFVRI
jgi:uncharacterized membrane protein